jgi:hypothetical protein
MCRNLPRDPFVEVLYLYFIADSNLGKVKIDLEDVRQMK